METEETIETTEEENLDENESPEESSKEDDSTKATPDKFEEKNRKLYARAKKAEEELKMLKVKPEETPKETSTETPEDVFTLAKTVASLKEYDPEELDFIQMMSKAKGISPKEAADTEEAKIYIAAKRQKVEDEKSKLEPSTKQSPTEQSVDDVSNEDLRKMSVKDKEIFLKKIGW